MMAHRHQRSFCASAGRPILNAACKEDPAQLGRLYNAVNLDIWDHDEQTNTPLKTIPNFVQGDVMDMPFDDGHFKAIVLGEFLEHCVYRAALRALQECKRVLADDGLMLLTFPLDDRAPEQQHAKHLLKVFCPGETGHDITVWHQTVWSDGDLDRLFLEADLEVVDKAKLDYQLGTCKTGWGIVLRKFA